MVQILPKIDFHAIREHETSQQRAFEEICYQLVPTIESLSSGIRLERRQNPDAGIEFSCMAPDGSGRWAWQAKYLFNLNAGAYIEEPYVLAAAVALLRADRGLDAVAIADEMSIPTDLMDAFVVGARPRLRVAPAT